MIISHKHKFIFIHIPKCAGSAICQSLIKSLHPESLDKGNFNRLDPNITQVFKIGLNQGNSDELNQHDTLKEVQNYFIEKNLDINDYFKFSFMRNPWDRRVSQHQYAKRMAKKGAHWAIEASLMPFKEFIVERNDSQLNWIKNEQGKVSVDFLGSGRNLQNEFNFICKKIGVSEIELSHINATKHKPYIKYYNNETRSIVASNCSKDIEYFNYKFGE